MLSVGNYIYSYVVYLVVTIASIFIEIFTTGRVSFRHRQGLSVYFVRRVSTIITIKKCAPMLFVSIE